MNTGKSGNTGRTSPGKTEGTPETTKPAGPAPVEAAKKFEELLKEGKKKGEASVGEGKKEAGIFDSHHQRVIPTAHKGVQTPLDKLKGQIKSGGEMKITKEGKSSAKGEMEEGGLKAQIFGKTDKPSASYGKTGGERKITKEEKSSSKSETEGEEPKSQTFGKTDKLQAVHGKLEKGDKKEGEGQGAEEKIKVEFTSEKEGEFKMKVNKGPEIPSAFLEAQQPAVRGPLGQSIAPVEAPQQTAPSAAMKEMAQLASTMLTRIMASHEASAAGKEIRMSFGDANPNLKNVDVVIKREGKDLSIEFITTKNVDAGNYINQNKEGLNTALRNSNRLSDVNDIRIDIVQTQSDTQKDDSQGQSRGRREQEPLEEEEQQP